ncbi:MAG TPA: ABC transporter permease subunit, partial [Thiolinea sp.]|nr:ABC transporter permease subunit [Thiolinea sp.]
MPSSYRGGAGRVLALAGLSGLVAVTGVAFYGLIGFSGQVADPGTLQDPYFYGILGFSLKQAALSAGLSVLLGYPVARALYYLPGLWFRRTFLTLCLLCFVLPTLVLITGLVLLLGHSGRLAPLLGADWNLYGLKGILLAHVFLNLPFVVRALYLQLLHIPDTAWRLALQLGLPALTRWRLVEWPMVRGRLLVLGGFVFVLCFNSFAVVLALGGGPQATTLELAVYQALKYDFNLPEALTLAWVQFAIAGTLFVLLGRLGGSSWLVLEQGGDRVPVPGRWSRLGHGGVYLLCALFLLLPLLVLLPALADIPASLRLAPLLQALLNSFLLALACVIPATLLAWLLLWPQRLAQLQQRPRRRQLLEWLSTHTLAAPAMVLSVGWYVFVLPRLDLAQWGPVLVVLLNLVLTLPFALQQLRPRLLQFDAQYAPLCAGLKLAWPERLALEWRWLGGSLRA